MINRKHPKILIAECKKCHRLYIGCGGKTMYCVHLSVRNGRYYYPRTACRTRAVELIDGNYGGDTVEQFAYDLLERRRTHRAVCYSGKNLHNRP